jgi:RNA polymerase subunit RPABC4/transcription elongation factor Spt4
MVSTDKTVEGNNQETKACPYCSELILATAKKCKHCGEILDQQMRDIDLLKKQSSAVVVNNNNNNNNSNQAYVLKRNYPWFWHFILTLCTGGAWLVVWIILYIFRDKNIYN